MCGNVLEACDTGFVLPVAKNTRNPFVATIVLLRGKMNGTDIVRFTGYKERAASAKPENSLRNWNDGRQLCGEH